MADKKVIDVEIKPSMNGIRSLNEEIKKLKKNIEEATDEAEVEKLNKQLKKSEDHVEGLNKAVKGIGLGEKFEDAFGDLAPLSSRLGELEDQMYELAFAGQADSEMFRKLQEEAAGMRQTIIEVDRQVDIMADNKGMSIFGDGVASVGDSLTRLDFDTAAKQASSLATAASKISFKSATKSIQQFGKVILNLGKALLVNPLFLMAAVIGVIVIGIYKLLDSLGILTDIFEAVGDAIGFVIQLLKDFIDWLGLSDFAGAAAAEASIERNKKLIESDQRKTDVLVDNLEHEISLRQAVGEETEDLERKKLKSLSDSAKAQTRMNAAIMASVKQLHGVESDEYKEAVKNAKDSLKLFREAEQAIELFEVTNDQRKKDKAKDDDKAAQDKAKQAAENAKRYAAERLRAEREIEDLRLQMIADDEEKALAILDVSYQRKIEDTKNNEALLDDEKKKLVAAFELEAQVKRSELSAKQEQAQQAEDKKKEDARLDKMVKAQSIADELEIALIKDQFERERAERSAQFDQKILDLEAQGLLTNEIEKNLKQQLVNDLEEIDKKAAEERDAQRQKELDDERALQTAKLDMAVSALQLAAGVADLFAEKGEKAARIAFNVNKAASIASATVDGYKAVLSTYAQTPGGIAIKSIAAGIAGSFAALQIANIARTQFQGGASGGSNASASGSLGAGSEPAAGSASPSFNLFGQSNNANTFTNPNDVEGQPQVIKAFVVESDITAAQSRVSMINANSEL